MIYEIGWISAVIHGKYNSRSKNFLIVKSNYYVPVRPITPRLIANIYWSSADFPVDFPRLEIALKGILHEA